MGRWGGRRSPGTRLGPCLGGKHLGFDDLSGLRVVALALQEGNDAKVDETADPDADGGGARPCFVVGDRDEIDGDRRDDRTRAKGHEAPDVLRLFQVGEFPDKECADKEGRLSDGAEECCFKHGAKTTPRRPALRCQSGEPACRWSCRESRGERRRR